jgi:O-acetyl-ADP-ribose deacetylase (regulator of RNase III)
MSSTIADKICFVIMPFGDKIDKEGKTIHFNEVYENFIEPAVKAAGINCLRCDKIIEAGDIHTKMFTYILEADVAVVDITMLNPNVFYELGLRHTFKKNVTVIIQQAGTQSPFNISGFDVTTYTMDDPVSLKNASEDIKKKIQAGLNDIKRSDSPVYKSLPNLKVENKPELITEKKIYSFDLVGQSGKQIGIITGDLQNVTDVDVWVNSENTNMQMARPYERSISGVIRYMGAKKSKSTGKILEDTIAKELEDQMKADQVTSVDPGCVLYTSAGSLTGTNKVQYILHAASVVGQVGVGYRSIENLTECVRNSLEVLDDPDRLANKNLHSILFPLMGTGISKGAAQDVASDLINAAISYLKEKQQSQVEKVYFLAFTQQDLEICERIMMTHKSLCPPAITPA